MNGKFASTHTERDQKLVKSPAKRKGPFDIKGSKRVGEITIAKKVKTPCDERRAAKADTVQSREAEIHVKPVGNVGTHL